VLSEWPTNDLDGSCLFELSVQYGMILEIPGGYNPDHHIDADCICPEEGDPWYEYTFGGKDGPGLFSLHELRAERDALLARAAAAEAQLATAREDALRDAKAACKRIRNNPNTTEQEAVGVLDCMLAIHDLIDQAAKPAPDAASAPGHTDMMVTPESLETWLDENPPPVEIAPEAVVKAALEWAACQAQSIDHHGWTRSQLAEIIRQGKNPTTSAAIIARATGEQP
jgi:hypothetical protein